MWNFQRPIFTQRPYQFTEISQRYFVSENRIANFPKFQKKVDWNFNQCFMQNTNFEFFTNITTQRFTLEGHFRCSHHFVTFCSQRVTISHMTIWRMSPISTCHQLRCSSNQSSLFNNLLRLVLFILRFNWPRSFKVIWSHLGSIRST